jgi:hypothetical protein
MVALCRRVSIDGPLQLGRDMEWRLFSEWLRGMVREGTVLGLEWVVTLQGNTLAGEGGDRERAHRGALMLGCDVRWHVILDEVGQEF